MYSVLCNMLTFNQCVNFCLTIFKRQRYVFTSFSLSSLYLTNTRESDVWPTLYPPSCKILKLRSCLFFVLFCFWFCSCYSALYIIGVRLWENMRGILTCSVANYRWTPSDYARSEGLGYGQDRVVTWILGHRGLILAERSWRSRQPSLLSRLLCFLQILQREPSRLVPFDQGISGLAVQNEVEKV